jgi:hypothetical protein
MYCPSLHIVVRRSEQASRPDRHVPHCGGLNASPGYQDGTPSQHKLLADWFVFLMRQGLELRRETVANSDGRPEMLDVPCAVPCLNHLTGPERSELAENHSLCLPLVVHERDAAAWTCCLNGIQPTNCGFHKHSGAIGIVVTLPFR